MFSKVARLIAIILIGYILSLFTLSFIAVDRSLFAQHFSINKLRFYKDGELIAFERRGIISFVNTLNISDRVFVLNVVNNMRKDILKKESRSDK